MCSGRQVTWGLAQSQSGQPISVALINPTHTHSSCSLWGCLATWDFGSSQEHFRTRRKGQWALGLPLQHRGKLANGSGDLNKKIKWESLKESWIFRFFFLYLHCSICKRGKAGENQSLWTVWLFLSISHLPSQELFVWKVWIFFLC